MKTTSPVKPKSLQDYSQKLNADLKIIQDMMRQYNIPSLCPDKKD
jgi:hypothetical protein